MIPRRGAAVRWTPEDTELCARLRAVLGVHHAPGTALPVVELEQAVTSTGLADAGDFP